MCAAYIEMTIGYVAHVCCGINGIICILHICHMRGGHERLYYDGDDKGLLH